MKQTKTIRIVPDFFNKTVVELDKKYFPDVKYYMDNKHTAKIHRVVELFNNGCIGYKALVERVAKECKDTKENIHNIISKNISANYDLLQYVAG